MATTIVTKSGSGAPTASDLVAGELAVDLTNKRLYTEDSGGTVLELGTNPSGNVTFGDNGKAIFGAGPELQIYSDGTTGQIAGNVNVTGSVTADGLTVDGAADINGDLEVGSAGAGTKAIVIAGSGSSTSVMDLKMFGGGTGNPTSILRHSSATKDFSILTGNSGAELTRLLVTEGGDLSLYEDTGTTPKLFWDASAESLGIGTNLPAYKLDVQGGAISAGNGTIKTGISYDTAGRLGTFSNHVLKLITNNTERMTIDAGGSVLIGKTTPTDLHNTWNHIIIGEKGAIISENGAGGIDGITLADNVYVDSDTGTYAYQTAAAASQITQSGGAITFSNADSGSAGAALTPVPRMTLDASGNLLVGDSSQLSSSKVLVSFNGTSHNGIVLKTTRAATGSSFEVYLNSSNQVAGSIAHSGSTTVSFNTSSDQRLKENIADADDAGAKIDSIQVRKFDWKADGSHQDYGMVAQELLEVAPEAVHQPQDPEEMMGVDYSKLVPMMLKEIQSLRARIAALES